MQRNWDDLRLFLAVAREQSLTGAGKVLQLDPATVGRRMGRLEQEMQLPLFVKSPQGYALTEAGARLQARAESVEQAMRSASTGVVRTRERLSGQIRIGAPDGCANYLLPQVCAQITRTNPELDLQIVALPRVFNLSRREADMAIGVSMPTAGRLTVKKITDYRLHFAASRSYLDAHPAPRTLDDLKDHQLVGYIPDMIFDRELDYLSALDLGRVPLASNSVSVQLNMIRQGAGIGVVHDFSLPAVTGVEKVLSDEVSLTRSYYLIGHADDQLSPQLSHFAECLAVGIRTEVAELEAKA